LTLNHASFVTVVNNTVSTQLTADNAFIADASSTFGADPAASNQVCLGMVQTTFTGRVVNHPNCVVESPPPSPPSPSPTPLPCEAWCASNTNSWTTKCTYSGTCAGCDACSVSPPPPSPPPSPSSQGELTLSMNAGWTWISLNVEAADISVSAIFSGSSVPLEPDDYLKNQFAFTQYYAGYGFFGALTTMSTSEMYAFRTLTTGKSFVVRGTPVSLPKQITLYTGWTWIPCPYQTTVALSAGVPTYSYAATNQVKSQTLFAEYYDGYGWFGTLSTMVPGAGYKVKVTSGGIATFPSQRRSLVEEARAAKALGGLVEAAQA